MKLRLFAFASLLVLNVHQTYAMKGLLNKVKELLNKFCLTSRRKLTPIPKEKSPVILNDLRDTLKTKELDRRYYYASKMEQDLKKNKAMNRQDMQEYLKNTFNTHLVCSFTQNYEPFEKLDPKEREDIIGYYFKIYDEIPNTINRSNHFTNEQNALLEQKDKIIQRSLGHMSQP